MSDFLRPDVEYTRNINVISNYYKQLAIYLNRRTGKSMDVCTQWIKKEFSEGGRFYKPAPIANVTIRDKETGDRRPARVPLDKLFTIARKNNLIVSPSLTFYVPASYKRSLLSIFIDQNIQKRASVKQEMFAAQAIGDELTANNKKNEQNSLKQRNNALSGAHSSPYTILYNKSTHSSLTSLCRSATSYGNANNEKLLAGSRHYWAAGIVINNILSTIQLTDFTKFEQCINQYNMHIPTVDETMDCIKHSTKLFWKNGKAMQRIYRLVESISPLERAAFVYIGDLYHIAKYNDMLVRDWLSEMLIKRDVPVAPIEEIEKRLDGDTKALVALLRRDAMGGQKNFKMVKEVSLENYSKLLATCEQIYDTTAKYYLFIQELLTSSNVPASIAKLPDTIRRVSLVSDTDSTMATAQWWADWYCNGIITGRDADDISDMMIYIATQNIAHMMARMSTNIGVEDQYRHRYAMKNEFKFSSFSLTNKAKHYFSLITSQEGVLKSDPELEVKGVALRTSNIPPIIMNEFRRHLVEISSDVMNGRNIKLIPFLHRIADIEKSVHESVLQGKYDYLKTGNLKIKSAYSDPETSNYKYFELWEEVFAPKYGHAGTPPFGVVKISVELSTKTQMNRWCDSMEDKELANRFRLWMSKYPKKKYTQLLLPETIVAVNGIPKEILDAANIRNIIFTSVEPYYHVLESLGIYLIDKHRTRLVSDMFGFDGSTTFIDTDCSEV